MESIVTEKFNEIDLNEKINDSDYKTGYLFKKLGEIFQDYMLSEIQSLGAFKYIKDKCCNDKSEDGKCVKQWVLMKINNKKFLDTFHKMQLGCPDLVPGIRIKNFWQPNEFEWVNKLIENFPIIKEELINLRNDKGFQPYKSPSYASDIKVKKIK